MREKCEYEIRLTEIARVTALQLQLALGVLKSPKEWRDFQLNGLTEDAYAKYLFVCYDYVTLIIRLSGTIFED